MLAAAVALLLASTPAPAQVETRGARVSETAISVEGAEHWQHWTMPTHAVDLDSTGAVVPHYFRQRFNVLDDFRTYRRSIEELSWGTKDRFKIHKGVGAFTSVPNVRRDFAVDGNGEMRTRSDLKLEKILDAHFGKYPGNATHLIIDEVLYTIVDTSMTAAKEGVLTLKSVESGATATLDFKTKDKHEMPIYDFFLAQGVSRLGSGSVDAGALFDGDPDTFWEPDPDDPIERWWIEIDLGRTVLVDELVLRFAEEGNGDPFLQFKVLTDPGQQLIQQEASELDFLPVAGTDAPNDDLRVFRFEMEDMQDAAPGWNGRMIETIRIVVFDTKGPRHSQLDSEEDWLALGAADRGDVVYFVQDQGGFEEPVSQEEYDQLPLERQGRRDYYRRERPRLADVEVWGLGDNIGPGIAAGGGSFSVVGEGVSPPRNAFDGDFNTYFQQQLPTPTLAGRGLTIADLGATFWLDELRISAVSILHKTTVFDGYIHRGSDGTRDARGRLKWVRLSDVGRERNRTPQYLQIKDQYDDAPRIQFLEARIVSDQDAFRTSSQGAGIVEYQLYTRAYPAQVELTSDLFALTSTRNLGRISWEADTPPGTRVEVRTRSGDLLGKVVRYFDESGKQISFTAWKGLRRPPAPDTSFVPTSGWSPWSNVYQASGDRVTSPGLRKFIQAQVKLITDDRESAASIRSLDIELVNPVGERILAELRPDRILAPGVIDTFEVFILPNFIESPAASRSLGFDEVLLEMGGGGIEMLEFALGADPETGAAWQVFRPDADAFVDEAGVPLEILRNRADSIWVRLPEMQNMLAETRRLYNRVTAEGDQVPVDQGGATLTAKAHGLLTEEEQGDIRYFSLDGGTVTEIDQSTYAELEPERQGPVRYFRVLQGDGSQFPFDANGDSLTLVSYDRLGNGEKGAVIAEGNLMRVTFRAPVFRNGTTLKLAARNSSGGIDPDAPWQTIEAGDATAAVEANTLSIGVPLSSVALDDVAIRPNPFTPNGDGVNDVTRIGFSVFRITTAREVEIGVYSLGGRCVWQRKQMVENGTEAVEWNGVDQAGRQVPPGMYIVKLDLQVDAENQRGATAARVISVAY